MIDGVLTVHGALGRAMKKIGKRSNEPLDFGDPIVDGAGMSIGSGDAMEEVVDGIPSIKFSKRVHDFIAQRTSKTVIVKLLGWKISYHAMSNKL
ncbi:hypothetical protein Goari_022461 [Gossypium aridum]|uniref:Uncharacterized protein n=1 Tax=Gossypium aridum TaxID=34290 RepID=A0A7J8YST5_GOSAI|nr:hypothetical protein [Gossypium aridum]